MTDNNKPKITIGITCYNAQDTIARAIKSAQNQDHPNTEIIIVDDCSTDNSIAIINKHKNITLIQHKTNQGPAAARQTIIDNAGGDFIAFFDDDDESLPPRIKTQAKRIESHESQTGQTLIACYASGSRIYPNGYELPLNAIGAHPTIPHGKAVANRLLFFEQTPGFHFGSGTPSCSLMARKTTFDTIGGFDSNFRRVEDIDFAIRLALSDGHFIGCPEPLFIQHATDSTDKAPEKNRDAEIQLAEKHKTYLQSINRYHYAKTWPKIRYYHFKKQYLKMISTLIGLCLRHPIKTTSHFLHTAPRRFLHERKMTDKTAKRITPCD